MDYPVTTLQQLRPLLHGLRKQAGLTQAGVASLLGITQQSYAKIEANPAATSVERLFTIVRLLGGDIALSKDRGDRAESGEPPASVAATREAGLHAPARIEPPSRKERW